MIVTGSPKLLFVHNQKAAGMSIERYLLGDLKGSKLLERHSYVEDGIALLGRSRWDEYHSFGFVRNPWDRLVSWYTMIQETPPSSPNSLWDYVGSRSNTFEQFITRCTDVISEERNGYVYEKSFVKPQFDYFTDETGNIAVNHIGRFENLQNDLDQILNKVGLPPMELPHLNKTRAMDYRELYTPHTQELVAERFKKDIEYFGYSFND
jgi:chondroitin 4-sulfotransferase 11